MSLESMKMVEKAELDAKKLIAEEKARKSAADVLENAKLVGKASCTDIDRASEDAIARLRAAAEQKLPDAARFIAERIAEDL